MELIFIIFMVLSIIVPVVGGFAITLINLVIQLVTPLVIPAVTLIIVGIVVWVLYTVFLNIMGWD